MVFLTRRSGSGFAALASQAWLKRPKIVRDLKGLGPVLARSGPLELRLATTKADIRQAQRLRFETFYIEGGAMPSRRNARLQRDKCGFDKSCDHLLVIDTDIDDETGSSVVGTYRLLRSDRAGAHRGFYSRTEFDIDPMLARHPGKRFLELGRSCVHANYRSKRVIDLLWRGIGLYARHHGIDVLIGCASLPGRDPSALATSLSYIFHHAAASEAWQVDPFGPGTRMDWLPKQAFDEKRALAALPPLIKAYVRAGGRFASRAVVDEQFGTVDLFTVLPLAAADTGYLARFAPAGTMPVSQDEGLTLRH